MTHRDYIKAGFRIMTLHRVENGECTCGDPDCVDQYKHPKARNWQHTPHWSEEQLKNMEQYGLLEQGFGVVIDNHLVIDIDPRNGGHKSYEKLCADTNTDYMALSGFVVKSGGGGYHIYFDKDSTQAFVGKLSQYPGIDFKSSGYVVGASSMHLSGNKYTIEKGSPSDTTETPLALVELLERSDTYRVNDGSNYVDISKSDIEEMLSYYKNTPDKTHDEWIQVGMAIHRGTNGEGFDLWANWLRPGETEIKPAKLRKMQKKWHSFGKHSANPITIGTLRYLAEQEGYTAPVTFESDYELPRGEETIVDLTRPPGFVGRVADWINQQSLYPREYLAAAAALTAVGNAGGLRFNDVDYGATSNLFMFCVAGASTGKEKILQSFTELMRQADLHLATVGKIKSEQEIIRNLLEHQAVFYNIDELGLELQKITNGAKNGAAYLDGVVGVLMSIFSKARGTLAVSGDVRREVKQIYLKELTRLRRKEDMEGEDLSKEIEQVEQRLDALKGGIEHPFLSMIGYTTPVTFQSLMTYEQGANGFFARCIVLQEKNVNPRPKKGVKPCPVPDDIKSTLRQLYCGGHYDADNERVEQKGELVDIPTTAAAKARLDEILEYFWQRAEEAKELLLEPIPRRGFELTLKISLILAYAEGIRTLEHVDWAFEFVKSDIEDKLNLVAGNMAAAEKRVEESMARAILNFLSKKEGETTGIIANRLRMGKKEDVEKMLAILENKSKIRGEETKRGTKKWYLV